MTITSYAQNFEDVLLWRALRHVEQGTYLDIGAQDPVQDSISLAFYEAGWRGTHVEPTPFYANKLREARPDETVIEAAVSNSPGTIKFHEFPNTGLSTGKPKIATHHVEHGYATRAIVVPTLRLDQLLERTGEVHWMKIDVEGMEADVLESWGESPVRPWVLVIEATVPNSQVPSHHEWHDLVVSRGYREVHFDGLSRYFVHEAHDDLAGCFCSPPNVFDGFQATARHFSTAMLSRLNAEQTAELQQQITSLEQRLNAAIAAERDGLSETERLNEELLATTQRLNNERRESELELRLAHQIELFEAGREREAASAAIVTTAKELARQEERAAQLGARLALAEEAANRNDERLSESQKALADTFQQLVDAGQARADAERNQAELTAALAEARAATDHLRRELNGELDRVRNALATADNLIRASLAEPAGLWLRLGQALGVSRVGPAWQRLTSWSVHAAEQGQPSDATNQPPTREMNSTMHIAASRDARNPYLRANSLPELLSWHDMNFVRCAFVTVLGRQPDPDGEAYYTDRIRRGHSKMEVLWQLRRSPEGPRHDPGIAGFDRALKMAALRRNSWIGWLFRGLYAGDGTTSVDQSIRQLYNSIEVLCGEQLRQSSFLQQLAARSNDFPWQLERMVGAPVMEPSSSVISSESVEAIEAVSQLRPADIQGMSSRERHTLSLIEQARNA